MEQHAYALDMSWPALLKELGIRTANVLRRAELPEDLFARPSARLDSAAYFRFWEALEAEAGDGHFVLRLYAALRSESFSPPLFAALCSPNLLSALQRLSQYKTLVAPMRLDVVEGRDVVTARLAWLDATLPPPSSLVAAELLFSVGLARMGTHELILPSRIVAEAPPQRTKSSWECRFEGGRDTRYPSGGTTRSSHFSRATTPCGRYSNPRYESAWPSSTLRRVPPSAFAPPCSKGFRAATLRWIASRVASP